MHVNDCLRRLVGWLVFKSFDAHDLSCSVCSKQSVLKRWSLELKFKVQNYVLFAFFALLNYCFSLDKLLVQANCLIDVLSWYRLINHRIMLEKLTLRSLSPGQTESQVDASWKLGATCDTVWPGLACACVDLRWHAMTCAHFGRDQFCTQVKASFSPFRHPTQVNASWLTSINLLLANEIEDSLP